jgi:hypothetical protein
MVTSRLPSETFGPYEYGHEIEEEAERSGAGKGELEGHCILLTLRRTGA